MTDERPTFGSLFAGIGGIDLGLERAGWRGRWQVEYEPFCQRVLAKHWPDVQRFGDIRDVHGAAACPVADADRSDEQHVAAKEGLSKQSGRGSERDDLRAPGCPNCLPYVDLVAGGFPCQPFSVAGKQRGMDDDRWLWPEFERCLRALRPRYVLVENVPGLLVGRGMDAVLGGLADLGYDTEWECIPAAAVGAPHLRYRVWIIGTLAYATGNAGWIGDRDGETDGTLAHPDGGRRGQRQPIEWRLPIADQGGDVAHAASLGPPRSREHGQPVHPASGGDGQASEPRDGGWWSVEPDVGRVAHGFPQGLDGHWASEWEGVPRVASGVPDRVNRLRALGNAVVPQVVEWIGRRIIESANEH